MFESERLLSSNQTANCLLENRHLTDPVEIDKKLAFGEYIKKETLSLISLSKYREMKRRYGGDA